MLGFSAFGQYWLPICFLNYLFHNVFSWCADGQVCAKENQWNCWHNEMMTILLLVCAFLHHYCDVIMGANASQITSLTVVYSIVYSHADKKTNQTSASLAFVRGIHRGPVNSPHKWPVSRKMFPFMTSSWIKKVCPCHDAWHTSISDIHIYRSRTQSFTEMVDR